MLYEIRLHGRGGQGVVTAATLLAEAAVLDGLWSQAIPFFGAERRGAPVVSFTRISDRPIRMHSRVRRPDAVVVLDERLLSLSGVLEGLKEGGVAVVNSSKGPSDLGLPVKCATVDATSIALELDLVVAGWPVVNTAMLGSVARALGVVTIKSIEECIRRRWPGEAGERNARAARLAYERTKLGWEG